MKVADMLGIFIRKHHPLFIIVIDVYFQAITICIKKADYIWFFSTIHPSPQLVNYERLCSYFISLRQYILSP